MALDIVSHMTQKANLVTLLASPLGEEGHKVAKGWTVVILIMILDVDVTAEGGPPALGAKGCVERLHRFAQGAADWRSGPRWSILSVLCPVHPLPLRGVPLKGKREVWGGKTESHIFHVPFRSFPLWW